jgi:spoIIIJ-associated protein
MDHVKPITDYSLEFLSQIGFGPEVAIQVQYDAPNSLYQILLQTTNPSLLIGYHGENLTSMQLLLSQHLHARLGEWLNLSLNVNDYKERRQSALHALADTAVTRVISTNLPHSLPPMPASDRRLIHLYLADHPRISTTSQGIGKNRSIIVSPKTA